MIASIVSPLEVSLSAAFIRQNRSPTGGKDDFKAAHHIHRVCCPGTKIIKRPISDLL